MDKLSSIRTALYTALCGTTVLNSAAANPDKKNAEERPNILWLTFEDASWYQFRCYGNRHISTPNIDFLARNGVQYTNAWSVGPQSSPSRSTIITGCYASSYGMDVHPVEYPTPDSIFFPLKLREAGYYCTNNVKTHYNTSVDHKAIWDECSKSAGYNSPKKPADAPFFAVYNNVISHMSSVRTLHIDGRRDYSKEGIFIDSLILPTHVPNLPQTRSDLAAHMEAVQDVDTWVGFFLKDLKEKNLDDNTIIFVYSDHGGCLPRGKGYLFETGLRVPLIVYFPEKWKHLAGGKTPRTDDRLISFTDLAPTVLSLAGVKAPTYIQGQAQLGKYKASKEKKIQFAMAANHLHHFSPTRAATNGEYKYLRTFIPYKQFAMRNYYQWGMPSNQSWDMHILSGKNENPVLNQPYIYHPAELLFNIKDDIYEVNDLSKNPQHAEVLLYFRKEMDKHIRASGDLGFFIPTDREGVNMYERVHKNGYPINELHTLVQLAGFATKEQLLSIEKYLTCDDATMRYWACVAYGQAALDGIIKKAPKNLQRLMDDANDYVAAEASFACAYLGNPKIAVEKLLNASAPEHIKVRYSLLECLSLDPAMRPYIAVHSAQLKSDAQNLPAKENEDPGYMARGILANLGEIPVPHIYGSDYYERGLKLNKNRRPMVPLP